VSLAERDFRDYLGDILDNARKLKSFVAESSFEDFQTDARNAEKSLCLFEEELCVRHGCP
jgi:uncharacterized protein with HEPN domain